MLYLCIVGKYYSSHLLSFLTPSTSRILKILFNVFNESFFLCEYSTFRALKFIHKLVLRFTLWIPSTSSSCIRHKVVFMVRTKILNKFCVHLFGLSCITVFRWYCGHPNIKNGKLLWDYSSGYINSTYRYSCNPGYELPHGRSANIICQPKPGDRTKGQWTPSLCTSKYCKGM